MTVLLSKDRGKMDYFKLSKLLNEEYYNENGKKKCTQLSLKNRFGLTGKSEVSEVLKIYPQLKKFFEQSSACRTFSSRQLIALSRCNDDSLREKLIDQTIKNKWSSEKIRKQVSKLNKISEYLLTEIKNEKVRECILNLCTGTSLFDLDLEKLREKIFKLFIENERNGVILKYVREFEQNSRVARDHRTEYVRDHKGSWDGWYNESYKYSPKFSIGSKMAWNFFQKLNHGKIKCFWCNNPIPKFKDFIAHHEDYEWDYLWFIFLDLDQKIFPCCNKCHQPGSSKNWKFQIK